MTFHRLGLML